MAGGVSRGCLGGVTSGCSRSLSPLKCLSPLESADVFVTPGVLIRKTQPNWSIQALRQFTVAELAGAILRRLGVVARGTPAVGPRFLFWFLKCGARYPKLFGRVFTLFPLSSCDSLNVRSGLLFFTAGHRNFWARGRFLGQKHRIPAYVQASFSRGTLGNRSVRFGISLGFDPKSRSRAQKCDGRRRKRVTESTHKTDI